MNKIIAHSAFTCNYPLLVNQLITMAVIANGDKKIEVPALWDTGATITCISEAVVSELGLIPTGLRDIKTPSGSMSVGTYSVDIKLPNNVTIRDMEVCDSKIGEQKLGLLIGMNIITQGDFAVSNFNGETSFTFRIPSVSKISFTNEARIRDLIGQPHGNGKRKKKRKK